MVLVQCETENWRFALIKRNLEMSTHQHIDKLYAQLKLLHCGVLTEMQLCFIFKKTENKDIVE